MEGLLLAVNNPPQPIDLGLNAKVPKSIESSLNAGVKGVLEGSEGGKDEVGGCWCMERESVEGLRVDRLVVTTQVALSLIAAVFFSLT